MIYVYYALYETNTHHMYTLNIPRETGIMLSHFLKSIGQILWLYFHQNMKSWNHLNIGADRTTKQYD